MRALILLLSGILTAVPVFYDKLGFLSWFSMIGYIVILLQNKPKYRYGLLFSVGYYFPLYYWFVYLYPLDFAGLDSLQSIAVISVAWVGLTLLNAAELALLPLLFRWCAGKEPDDRRRHPLTASLLLAAAFCLLEWGQTQTWMGVPYFRLALSQTGCLPMLQSASLLGSLFTGFLIVLVNALLAHALLAWRNNRRRAKLCCALCALLLAGNALFGALAMARPREGEEVTVAAIQGNVASGEKWNGSVYDTLDRYLALSETAADGGATLVVWPETAINVTLNQHPSLLDPIRRFAVRRGVTVLVGAFYENAMEESFNALYAVYPDGTVSQTPYAKRHLVPFGEYLPMAEVIGTLIPPLAEINMFSDDLRPGQDSALLDTAYGKAGGLICFDSIYEMLTLDAVRDGASYIALATNDSWYRDSASVYVHNRHAILRAVESGRDIIRAANTGISSVISHTGQIRNSLGPLKEGYVIAKIQPSQDRTLYSYLGNTFVLLCTLFSAGMLIAGMPFAKGSLTSARKSSHA